MPDQELALLNVFDVEDENGTRHLIALVEPVLAGAVGIDEACIVGEFDPTSDGGFDPQAFRLNRTFVETVERYINEVIRHSPDIIAQAQATPGQPLALIDPRNTDPSDSAVPAADMLGRFEVDSEGKVVPDSFRYQFDHVLFDPKRGLSGLLEDQQFYDWLHPEAKREA